MPRMNIDTDNFTIAGNNNFGFSAEKIENLGAANYTLVDIQVDETGSVFGFQHDLILTLKNIYEACKLFPTAENILLRVSSFSTMYKTNLKEFHGFLQLKNIDSNSYKLNPNGTTPLYDAFYTSIGATLKYAENLRNSDYDVNGICIVITDGEDNASVMTPNEIKKLVDESKKNEKIESLTTILVGVNSPYLFNFHNNAGFDQFIDMPDASPKNFAKLANFISKSVSSVSSSINQGKSALIAAPVF